MTHDTTTYKKALQNELALVEAELKDVGQINPDNPADWEGKPDTMDTGAADRNEVADSIGSYENNTAILKQLEIRLNSIKAALGRIEAGSFGICKVCGKEIEQDRLDANPAAETCKDHIDQE